MDKLAKLREMLPSLGVDGMLITGATNRRYMTGFTGSAGVVLISPAEAKLIVDFRYVEQAAEQAPEYEVVRIRDSLPDQVALEAEKMGIARLAFERDHITFGAYEEYSGKVKARLTPAAGVVESLRMIKTEQEIECLRKAADIADRTFSRVLELIRPGVAEKEIADEMESIMRQLGADSSGFAPIIASGWRAALPHGLASDKKIEKGDAVILDFGACYRGYRSDMTRTVAVGDPGDRIRQIYEIVLDTQRSCLARLGPGVSCREVDETTHEAVRLRGYGEHFGHGSGHGIGLDIHEEPFFSPKSDKTLQPGMVVTFEPGIYLPGLGGVRIEDDVLITAEGAEVITRSPKELIVL